MKFLFLTHWLLSFLSGMSLGLKIYIENKRAFCANQPKECVGTEEKPFGTLYTALKYLESQSLQINKSPEELFIYLKKNPLKEPFLITESEIPNSNIFDPTRLIRGNF